ncbi:MAG: N-acetylglucosamine-6-phosphate deacetylase [Thermosediminibacteraceae bacterium]|nr:N-acetylglucosamine-6-phosphate deacetylase [Thermosediminibacteraceae bacterium]
MKVLIKNARVVTPYEVLEDGWVLIDSGRIAEVKQGQLPEGSFDRVVDAEGCFLSPGFIDIHNHGGKGRDFMDATFDAIDTIARFHLKNGVTGFLATVMTAPFEEMKEAVVAAREYLKGQRPEEGKAELLGIYVEGPYFSLKKKGAQPGEHIKKPELKELEELITASEDTVKVVSLASEVEGSDKAVAFLKEKGIVAALGHTDATYEEAKRGIDLGIRLSTHTFNGMRGFEHREPGAAGAVLTDERVSCELICDGVHLHPAAVKLVLQAKGKERVILVSDAMMAAGLSDGEYTLGGQRVFVKGGRARLADGTIAGSTLSLDRAVRYLVKVLGVPVQDAVRMASLNPATIIGEARRKGSVEVGKDADLVAFDDDIRVRWAMVRGVFYRP